jgi:23S rRNA (adenine2503-C2)-methyltransferase
VTADPKDTVDLRDLTHPELERYVEKLGERRFRADQLFRWLHGHGITDLDQMTNVAQGLRLRLAAETRLTTLKTVEVAESEDGSAKLAFRTSDGLLVESVLMPEDRKVSVCLSTQVGCAMGCTFCATAGPGLTRSLTAGEIVDQLYRIRAWMQARDDDRCDDRRISNIVYMGMGEPLANLRGTRRSLEMIMHPLGANLSSRRITVSTAGVVPGLVQVATWDFQVNLAISLNATTQAVRERLMPIARKYPLERLFAALRAFPLEKRRRITFEYVLIAGINDTDEDAARLPRLVAGLPSKFNIIPFNPIEGCDFRPPDPDRVEAFCASIRRAGYTVITRHSRGADISAACGQLAGRLKSPARVG